MNFSRKDWIRFLHLLGKNLLRDAWYPSVAIGIGQAIVSPEAAFLDCLATAAVLLVFISTASMFCFAVSWGLPSAAMINRKSRK